MNLQGERKKKSKYPQFLQHAAIKSQFLEIQSIQRTFPKHLLCAERPLCSVLVERRETHTKARRRLRPPRGRHWPRVALIPLPQHAPQRGTFPWGIWARTLLLTLAPSAQQGGGHTVALLFANWKPSSVIPVPPLRNRVWGTGTGCDSLGSCGRKRQVFNEALPEQGVLNKQRPPLAASEPIHLSCILPLLTLLSGSCISLPSELTTGGEHGGPRL